jgi:hypothetical protein
MTDAEPAVLHSAGDDLFAVALERDHPADVGVEGMEAVDQRVGQDDDICGSSLVHGRELEALNDGDDPGTVVLSIPAVRMRSWSTRSARLGRRLLTILDLGGDAEQR